VGDDAFFASLKLYLTTNKFSTAEISQLRLAFEQITGEDLNWFFNEWYLNKGYPALTIDYSYNDTLKLQSVIIRQVQDFKTTPLFKLPLDVDIYTNGKALRQRIWVDKESEKFTFPVISRPDLVNVDAEKQLLCRKTDKHSRDEYIYMFYHAPLYLDRAEALNKIGDDYEKNTPSSRVVQDALNDKFWNIRNKAIGFISVLARSALVKDDIKNKLMMMATKDEKADVRASAIKALAKYYDGDDVKSFLMKAVNDSSYDVMASALKALVEKDKDEALELAKQMESTASSHAISAIADIYAENGAEDQNPFFLHAFDKIKNSEKYSLIQSYSIFLAHCKNPVINQGTDKLLDLAQHVEPWYMRMAAMNSLGDVSGVLGNRIRELQSKIAEDKKNNFPQSAISSNHAELEQLEIQQKQLKDAMNDIKSKEKDKNLLKLYKMTAN
jgi:aminopeptidase N